jgi:hypothetical protein
MAVLQCLCLNASCQHCSGHPHAVAPPNPLCAHTPPGLAYAPLLAARLVCGRLARPAAVVGAAVAAVRGVARLVAIRGMSPGNMLRKLQEAALEFGGDCLEVRVRWLGQAGGRWGTECA